jgi:hypothetical protein
MTPAETAAPRRPRNHTRLIALVLLAVVLLVGGGGWWWMTSGPLPFDKATWDSGGDEWRQYLRQRMADRLLQSRELIGKTEAEVTAMLGPADTSGYFRPEWSIVYWLGPERGFFGIDSEWLVLRLGADGRVTEQAITRD